MSVERGPKNINTPKIDVLIKDNFDWVVDGKGQFNCSGYPFEELVEPSLKYLLSLYGPEDREAMRTSCQTRLAKIGSPEEQFRLIANDIVADWNKNAP